MKNTADAKLDRLLAVAREEQIDTGSMEEFFETRIVARLRELREEPAWYTLVWRMIPLFTAVAAMVAIGAFTCLLYTSPSPRDRQKSRMPSSA